MSRFYRVSPCVLFGRRMAFCDGHELERVEPSREHVNLVLATLYVDLDPVEAIIDPVEALLDSRCRFGEHGHSLDKLHERSSNGIRHPDRGNLYRCAHGCASFHLASDARFALALRSSAVIAAALAFPPAAARRLSATGSGRGGASNVSSISPVAIFMTWTAHGPVSAGRHSPFGPFGISPPVTAYEHL